MCSHSGLWVGEYSNCRDGASFALFRPQNSGTVEATIADEPNKLAVDKLDAYRTSSAGFQNIRGRKLERPKPSDLTRQMKQKKRNSLRAIAEYYALRSKRQTSRIDANT